VQRFVESPLSVQVLKGTFRRGDVVQVDVDDNGLVFHRVEGASFQLPVKTDADANLS